MPQIKAPAPEVQPKQRRAALIEEGSRNQEMTAEAIRLVAAVDDPAELFANLQYVRDEECENPSTLPNEELQRIADWAWTRRLEARCPTESRKRIVRSLMVKTLAWNR